MMMMMGADSVMMMMMMGGDLVMMMMGVIR